MKILLVRGPVHMEYLKIIKVILILPVYLVVGVGVAVGVAVVKHLTC